MSNQVLAIDGTQLPELAPVAPASESAAILSMIERAARDPSVDIEKFERLMAMRERVDAMNDRAEKRAAEVAFASAVASAKGEIEPITRNATGNNNKKYADFGAIARAVDPILAKNGLSYRFRASQGERITVTCIISHVAGHSEENTLSGAPDTSGNKNAIQSIGSTLTYLQRYTLVLALGLASSADDDGRGAGASAGETIEAEQIVELQRLIVERGVDKPKFLQFCKVESLLEIPAKEYPRILSTIKQKAVKP